MAFRSFALIPGVACALAGLLVAGCNESSRRPPLIDAFPVTPPAPPPPTQPQFAYPESVIVQDVPDGAWTKSPGGIDVYLPHGIAPVLSEVDTTPAERDSRVGIAHIWSQIPVSHSRGLPSGWRLVVMNESGSFLAHLSGLTPGVAPTAVVGFADVHHETIYLSLPATPRPLVFHVLPHELGHVYIWLKTGNYNLSAANAHPKTPIPNP